MALGPTWSDDEGQAGHRRRLGDLAARGGPGLLGGLQLVGDAAGGSPPVRRPRAGAVATETDAAQVGHHPV